MRDLVRNDQVGAAVSEIERVAERKFTMDVYSRIIEGMQSDAMALLDEVLPPGKNKINAKLTPTF